MLMRTTANLNRPSRAVTAAALILLCGALSGCDRRSPEQVAIEQAAMKLQSLSAGGGGQSVLPAVRLKTLEAARQTLAAHKDSTASGTAGPLNQMLAEVASQMSEIELGKAAALENEAAAQVVNASRFLQLYTQQAAASEASGKVDLSGEITKLADQKRAREAELETTRKSRAAVKAVADKLTSEAAGAMESAKSLRKQATEMQARLSGVSATEGLTIVQQAAEVSRQADAAERKSAEITVSATAQQSQVADLDRTIGSLERTIKLVDDSATSLRARSEQTRARATETKGDAQRLATDINSAIDGLTTFRAGDLDKALSNAEKYAKEALAASKKAGGTDRVASASYQLNLASVMMTRAQGELSLARLLAGAAAATPALPDQAGLAARATKANADATAAIEAARASYKEVKEAFDGVGGSLPESTKKTFEKLAASLTALSNDRAPMPTAVEPGVAATSGDANATIVNAVKARAAELAAASNAMDSEKIVSFVKATDAQKQVMRTLITSTKSFRELDDVVQSKLGKPLVDALGPQGAMVGGLAAAKMDGGADDSNYVVAAPDRVVATAKEPKPDAINTTTWVLESGQWYTEFPSELTQITPMLPIISGLGKVFGELTADVNAGKITSDEQLQQSLTMKMAPIMMKMQGGMGMPDPNK
jgi:hypothetical protein